MTETSFMHLSSEQELVHNRLRLQKWSPPQRLKKLEKPAPHTLVKDIRSR